MFVKRDSRELRREDAQMQTRKVVIILEFRRISLKYLFPLLKLFVVGPAAAAHRLQRFINMLISSRNNSRLLFSISRR